MEDKTFFYPNCCHVCKKWDVPLTSCAKCHMISYCNEKHQKQHWPQHKQICAAIKRMLEDKEYMNTEEISTKTWINIRNKYLNKVSAILQRDVRNEECEMFQYPKACATCHRQDIVIRCNACPSAAFCDKHREDSEHRVKYCKLLRDSFEINNCFAMTKDIDISYVNHLSNKTPFYDMKSFLDTYVPFDKNNVYLQILHSNEVTYPLTVYFCMQKLKYFRYKTLSIHIMGAHLICTREDLELWKMLLILIPTLTTLTITFIQTKNACDISTEVINVSETKKFVANVRCMLYEDYMGTTHFEKPNFIVGFNARIVDDIYGSNKSVNISEILGGALGEQKRPCILIFKYIYRVHREMLTKMEKFFFGTNPFTDLMPCRHFLSERIYYRNNYLIIFNDLGSSKVFTDKKNQCILLAKTTRE